jgi:hypothetical protein
MGWIPYIDTEKVSMGGEGHVSGSGACRIFRCRIVVFRAFR